MNQERWAAVDQYITDLLVRPDPALDAATLSYELKPTHWTTVPGNLRLFRQQVEW